MKKSKSVRTFSKEHSLFLLVFFMLFICAAPNHLFAEDYYIADDDIENTTSGLSGPITDSGNYLEQTMECSWATNLDPDDPTGTTYLADPDDSLVSLANKLENDPLKIFKWVYNNIEFLDNYSNSRLGAYATYITGHGNEWDTSSLLIALLRISGFEARYILYGEGDEVSVEVKLPQTNYRGHGSQGQQEWTPLVPWYKQADITNTLDIFPNKVIPAELDFDFDDYLQTVKQKTVLELYEEKIQAYLNAHPDYNGKTVNDLGRQVYQLDYSASLLPASYPTELDGTETNQVFAEIPDEKRTAVTIRIKNDENDSLLLEKTVYLPEIAGRRLCLGFIPATTSDETIIDNNGGIALTPDGDADVKPVLQIDGEVFYEGAAAIELGKKFYLQYTGSGFTDKNLASQFAGTFMQMAFDPLAASTKTIEKLKEELQDLTTDSINDDDTQEEYLGRMAKILSDSYLFRYVKNSERVAQIFNGIVGWNRISPTFISTFPRGIQGSQESKFLAHPMWTMDAQSKSSFYHREENEQLVKLSWDDDYFTFLRTINSYSSSYNEALVLEDWQDTPSLSTIKGLMVANDELNIGVRELTAADITELNSLKYRELFNWSSVSDAMWYEIMVYLYATQDWGEMPAQGTSGYTTQLNQVKTMCQDGTIPLSYLEHLLTEFIPANSLADETIDQIIGYLNDGATVQAPLELIPYNGLHGSVHLVTGDGYDGYFFSMDDGELPTNGAVASSNVETDPSYSSWDHVVSDYLSDYTATSLQHTYSMPGSEAGYSISTGDLGSLVSASITRVGDPVDMVNGEFYIRERPDFIIKSRGFPIAVVRKYRNQAIYNGPFGFGWTWNHGERIMVLANGDLNYYDANAKPQKLTHNGDHTYSVPKGSTYTMDKISVVNDGWHYVLTRQDYTKIYFNGEGYLIRKEDQFGNYLKFEYGDNTHPDRITAIKDTLDRPLTFTYNDNGKVESITDFSGRSCSYTYDSDDLISFTDLEQNTTGYSYLSDQENPLNNHNLSTYTLPNGDTFEIGYYKNDQVAYHRNPKGDTFNFLYSRLNGYSETWNESGYYRKVFFDEDHNVTRIDNEDGTFIQKRYDEYHNMLSLIDGNGYTSTYEYGTQPALRLLHSKTNALNETWSFIYDSANNPYQPSIITNPLGIETHITYWPGGYIHQKIHAPGYSYSLDGQLVSDSGAEGFITSYDYDEYGNLIGVTDPLGHSVHFEYDTNYLDLITKIDPNRYLTTFEYYQADNQENMPPGMIRSTTIDTTAELDAAGYTMTFEYNQYNQMTKATDSLGHVTRQEYDVLGQPTKTIAPNEAEMQNIYDTTRSIVSGADIIQTIDPLGSQQSFQYDPMGNVIMKYDRNGNPTRYAYDGMNRLIEEVDSFDNSNRFFYDGNGRLIRTVDKKDNEFIQVYDGAGRKISETDAVGNITTFAYDAAGRLVQRTDASNRADGGIVTAFGYDALNRLITKTVSDSPTDRVYSYRYNAANRLIRETLPLGNYTTYEYDPAGNKTCAYQYDRNAMLLRTTAYIYYQDTRNLLAEVIVDGGKDGSNVGTRFEYDALGRQTAKIDPLGHRIETVYDMVGNPVAVSTPTGVTENTYDLNNRILQTINPLGQATSREYDANGNIINQRDALGHTTNIFYDQLNRKIGVEDALGAETLFDYDPNNNLIRLTDANGGITRFTYDENNRKLSEQRPEGQKTTYYYNELGQVRSVVYGGGNMIKYDYNVVGQPQQVEYYAQSFDANPAKIVDYTYDINGNLAAYSDGTTSASYVFDDLHRKTHETVNYPNFSRSFSYSYPNNWQQKFTGPDGNTITADYDGGQRLIDISIPGAGQVNYGDYEWRRPQSITLPGNNTITRSYDAVQRTIGISAVNGLMQRSYDYSAIGEVLTKVTEHGLYTYTYDALSRLTDAVNPNLPEEHFTYDKLGNRVTDNTIPQGLEYNKNNELIRLGTVVPTFDDNGNMTENPWATIQQKYVYDATKRLKQINDINQNVVAEYYYDPFGRRLWKDVGGARTYFMYANEGLIAEFDTNGNEICSYGYVPGSKWTTNPLYQKRSGSFYWYLNDHIGTPQKMIDSLGNVVWAARYDSFGNTIIDTETVENNLRFSGQYYDQESGLHYNWHRYYDPFLGRYIQSDPLALDAGMNFFVYVGNSPLNYIDPMGLEPDEGEDGYYDGSGWGSYGEEDTGQGYNSGGYADKGPGYGYGGYRRWTPFLDHRV